MQDSLHFDSDVEMNQLYTTMDFPFDSKLPGVVYQDKLISDALLSNVPIKSEHSYSLNSDGDSTTDSPHSLQNKIEGNLIYATFFLIYFILYFIFFLTSQILMMIAMVLH